MTRNDNKIFLIIVLFAVLYFIGNYTSFVAVSGHAIPIGFKPLNLFQIGESFLK